MKLSIVGAALVIFQCISLSPAETVNSGSNNRNWKSVIRRKRSVGTGYGERNWNYAPGDIPAQRFAKGFDAHRSLSKNELRHLEAMYGADLVQQHYGDFVKAREIGKYGSNEHRIPWRSIPRNQPVSQMDKEALADAKLSAINYQEIKPSMAKIYKDHSFNVQTSINGSLNKLNRLGRESHVYTPDNHENCNIHGLWMSSVVGAAIELLPVLHEEGRIEIKTRIFDLLDTSRKGIISSKWKGNGMISPESPTTMTIVFQEHINHHDAHHGTGNYGQDMPSLSTYENALLPKTAVFVGQCLVCENSPVLQGTWTVFPSSQSCVGGIKGENSVGDSDRTEKSEINQAETLHLLKKMGV